MDCITPSGFLSEESLSMPLSGNPEPLPCPTDGFFRLYKVRIKGKLHILKTLRKDLTDNPVYRILLQKEFDLSYELDHPNIRRTIGMTGLAGFGDCLLLEYIDGTPLSSFIGTDNLSIADTRRILCQICSALEYIHNRQIIHRDLKPSNVLVTHNGGNVKLIDFSLADSDSWYFAKSPAGTRGYAAPEVIRGGRADIRSDIFSLGRIIQDIAPGHFTRIAARCTASDPDLRYSSASEVRKELTRGYWPSPSGIQASCFALCAAASVLTTIAVCRWAERRRRRN